MQSCIGHRSPPLRLLLAATICNYRYFGAGIRLVAAIRLTYVFINARWHSCTHFALASTRHDTAFTAIRLPTLIMPDPLSA
ncbi:hypothetical protein Nepgr_018959 [Nepenthes gracilis]|uniref:Uncharacterized protein n=1 Tax=Nepenthes gracilis TaxID=150966 RepID=A0AAD3SSB3_NEPGR|nr:hypothetical protein Nepgr_018959 [Nepenthes gracilis]